MKSIKEIIQEEIQLNQNFWNWFGDSKVRNPDGSPKLMYHGTVNDFSTFEIGKFGFHFGTYEQAKDLLIDKRGEYMPIENPDDPNGFAKHTKTFGRGSNMMPVYLSIQNPLRILDPEDDNPRIILYGVESHLSEEEVQYIKELIPVVDSASNEKANDLARKAIIQAMQNHGYDGCYYENTFEGLKHSSDHISWVAFESQQIKSASGNNGEYSSSPDITKENLSEAEDYRGHHEAPRPDDSSSPMYDTTNTYGEDIYGPQAMRLYGHHPYDNYSIELIQRARNKPNMQVKIYRAIPKVISNIEKINDYTKRKKEIQRRGKLPRDATNWRNPSEYYEYLSDEIERLMGEPSGDKVKINNGDWVTINPAYAREHGQSNIGQFRVLTKTVSAKNLYNEGDVNEWGYNENVGSLNEDVLREDFVGGQLYGYHCTPCKNLESIEQNGFKIGPR